MSSPGDKAVLEHHRWLGLLAAGLVVVGTLSRLAPLADPGGRLLRQFMTEDGYLMQTVARNMAIGLGMSVSEGTIATNGVQPLATFVFSVLHLLSGGDKIGGIAGVTLFSALVSLVAAGLLYSLARKLLSGLADGRALALLVSALWFSSPAIVRHSMNGLETGLYFAIVLATLNVFLNFAERSPIRFTGKQMLALGVMFGLCFLARNDGAFFIAAVLLARFIISWPRTLRAWTDRAVEAIVPGLISMLIASPWLAYNYNLFGSVMPISGIAQSHGAQLGQNMAYVPALLLEYVGLIVAIPASVETKPLTIALAVAIVAAVLGLASWILWRQSAAARYVVATCAAFGVLLILFYGLFFGASYFMARYLSVLSPFLALAGIIVAHRLLVLLNQRVRGVLLTPALIAAALAVVALNALIYRGGMRHEHFQVVDWVEAHVPPQTWVGAVQTGTLGFFHDRTINLDGKVNPEALRARLDDGDVISYVLASKIEYLVDWHGIAGWSRIQKGAFNRKFKLVLSDEAANLAVLKRVDDSP
jgi:hypothetical protein